MSYNTAVGQIIKTAVKKEKSARAYFRKLRDISRKIDCQKIGQLIGDLERVKESESTLFIAGNGGSAATASHWVCDLQKSINVHSIPGKGIRAVSLPDNIPLLTAIANDIGYDQVFAYQLEQNAKKGDMLLVISVSGKSPNIIRALETAHKLGLKSWSIVGCRGGAAVELSDNSLIIPDCDYGLVEDFQMILDHLIVNSLKRDIS